MQAIYSANRETQPWAGFHPTFDDFDDLFLHTLQDIYYAEHQIEKALPDMVEKASDAELKKGFRTHLKQTKGQIKRLDQAFKKLKQKPQGTKCPAIDGIIDEANEIAGEIDDKVVLNAALIAAAQAVEHYEITRYGTLVAWAKLLGRNDVARLLDANLKEEKATDKKLNGIAKRKINKKALAAQQEKAEARPRPSGRKTPCSRGRRHPGDLPAMLASSACASTLRMTFGSASSRSSSSLTQRAPLGAFVARGTCAVKTVSSSGKCVNTWRTTPGSRRHFGCPRGAAPPQRFRDIEIMRPVAARHFGHAAEQALVGPRAHQHRAVGAHRDEGRAAPQLALRAWAPCAETSPGRRARAPRRPRSTGTARRPASSACRWWRRDPSAPARNRRRGCGGSSAPPVA